MAINSIKAGDTEALIHGNTTIKPGDWVALGSSGEDPYKDWVRVVSICSEERFKVYPRTSGGVERKFFADVVEHRDRDEEPGHN